MLVKESQPAHTICPHTVPAGKQPGHWLLASLGKKVLRPGGRGLTWRMLEQLAPSDGDGVVEFAPGMGATAEVTLRSNPRSYTAVERDAVAAERLQSILTGPARRCVNAGAEATQLPGESFSIVYGEAMLTMQTDAQKLRILREARRILKAGGRYGIHELCLTPEDITPAVRREIEREMSLEVHVGVRPLTAGEWRTLLEAAGFEVRWEGRAPMHLLEPARMIQDEGIAGALRILWNLARKPVERRRVFRMRRMFRRYQDHLAAVSFVSVRI